MRRAALATCAALVLLAALGGIPGLAPSPAGAQSAASVAFAIADDTGRALDDAVVWLEPVEGKAPVASGRSATIEQTARRFVPRVSIVQTGTSVTFPNNDTVRHHVYSFSPAKTFELKLYIGTPAAPVVFDKPGLIVLGCNIHDAMAAWVQVVDSPWFARSDADGGARITGVPPGEYRLQVTHPQQRTAAAARTLRVAGGAAGEPVALRIALQPDARRP